MPSRSIASTARQKADAIRLSGAGRLLALTALVLLFGWLLGHAAHWFADGLAVNAQLYFHAFRIGNLRSPWVLAPMRFLSGAVLQYSALASWAFACGYWCARGARQMTIVWLGTFIALTFVGTAATTSSVRVAQPWFFESLVTSVAYPATITVLFVAVPAALAARTVRGRSTSAPVIWMVAVIGIALAWWHASELRDAVTFGCVLPNGSAITYCASRDVPWGAASASVLTALAALMAWDALRSRRPVR